MSAHAYHVTRSKRRSIAIHLRAGRVEVRAPLFVTGAQIDVFVASRADWITRHLPQSVVIDPWCDGLSFQYQEQPWQLRWREARGRAKLTSEPDICTLWFESAVWNGTQAKRLFLRWLSEQAQARLLPAIVEQARVMGDAERLQGVVLRYTKSMWGRCSARGEILLNPAVLLSNDACIRYLLVHELAHLRHLNHSPAFWQRVAQFCPEWQQARQFLRQQNISWLHQAAAS